MPLKKGSSKKTKSENISEMIRAGKPPRVAKAAAEENARRSLRRTKGSARKR